MKRALIIDDENLAVDNIRILLNTLDEDIEIVGSAENVLEAIKLYNETQPNIVFLDINMPNGNGFDFLECVDFDKTFVIFVTAHDDFAIKAIKYQVFDYLVKPIDIDLLEDTLQRLNKEIATQEKFVSYPTNKYPNNEAIIDKIAFSTSDEIIYLSNSDILYCESDNSYCTIHTTQNSKVVISSSLHKLQEKLNSNFYRAHQSYLVNKNEIAKFLKQENKILLSDGSKIPVSKTNKKGLLELMNS